MTAASHIYVGTAGWSYKDWEGIVYPAQLKKVAASRRIHGAVLRHAGDQYVVLRTHQAGMGQVVVPQGAADANPAFLFTAKLNRAFTHSPIAVVESTSASTIHVGPDDERLAKAGLDSIAGENMLGAVLVQFPISFKNTNQNRDYLDALLEKFRQYPLVIEVRHNSWTNEGTLRYFAQKGVAFCNIDQPLLGKAVSPSELVTSPVGYVRLHGRNYEQWFDSDSGSDRYNYLYNQRGITGMEGPRGHYRRQGAEDLRRHQQPLRRQGGSQRTAAQTYAQRRYGQGATNLAQSLLGVGRDRIPR